MPVAVGDVAEYLIRAGRGGLPGRADPDQWQRGRHRRDVRQSVLNAPVADLRMLGVSVIEADPAERHRRIDCFGQQFDCLVRSGGVRTFAGMPAFLQRVESAVQVRGRCRRWPMYAVPDGAAYASITATWQFSIRLVIVQCCGPTPTDLSPRLITWASRMTSMASGSPKRSIT